MQKENIVREKSQDGEKPFRLQPSTSLKQQGEAVIRTPEKPKISFPRADGGVPNVNALIKRVRRSQKATGRRIGHRADAGRVKKDPTRGFLVAQATENRQNTIGLGIGGAFSGKEIRISVETAQTR